MSNFFRKRLLSLKSYRMHEEGKGKEGLLIFWLLSSSRQNELSLSYIKRSPLIAASIAGTLIVLVVFVLVRVELGGTI